MNFSFSGRHMAIGEALTNKANDAFKLLEDKYHLEFLDVTVVMNKEKYLFITDITVNTNSGNSYFVSNEAEDPIVRFEITLEKLEQQMQRKKKNGRASAAKKNVEYNSYDNFSHEDESCDDQPLIIAEVLDDIPLMSVSDAAKKLNAKRKVFIFENISNSTVNVVYTRDDGNIGWLDYKNQNK